MIIDINKYWKYVDLWYHRALRSHLVGCRSVLDVGCGSKSPIRYIKKNFYSEGIDIFKPSIIESKKKKIHDKYVLGDIQKLDMYYRPRSFDAVIALDVLEHFKSIDALKLVKMIERVARKKVIILTPNGHHLDMVCEGDKNNLFQKHKSGWFKKDLEDLGYKVFGLRGLKYIRNENATIKSKPWIFWGLIAFLSEPILYFVPDLSYDLFAVKNISHD